MTGDQSNDGMYAQVNTCESLLRSDVDEIYLESHVPPVCIPVPVDWPSSDFLQTAAKNMTRSSHVILFSTGLLTLLWLSAGALCCLRSSATVLQYVARGLSFDY